MQATPVFECGNPKCGNTIEAEGLNAVKLKALRRWPKYCDRCKQRTVWLEKLSMLSGIETKTIKKPNGGKNAQTDSGYIH